MEGDDIYAYTVDFEPKEYRTVHFNRANNKKRLRVIQTMNGDLIIEYDEQKIVDERTHTGKEG